MVRYPPPSPRRLSVSKQCQLSNVSYHIIQSMQTVQKKNQTAANTNPSHRQGGKNIREAAYCRAPSYLHRVAYCTPRRCPTSLTPTPTFYLRMTSQVEVTLVVLTAEGIQGNQPLDCATAAGMVKDCSQTTKKIGLIRGKLGTAVGKGSEGCQGCFPPKRI
jgi:hypothetical protein